MSETDGTALYSARTIRVHAPNLVEARVDLGFGVELTRLLRLDNVSTEGLDDDSRARATHCLVVLAGGKRLLVQIDDPSVYQHPLDCRVYLEERTHGRLVGHTAGLSPSVDPILELSPFMNWLGARGFNVDDVKLALNGNGYHRGSRS